MATKTAIKSYIKKDIKKIELEKTKIKPSLLNETLRTYLVARVETLKEVLTLLA